MQQQGFFKRLYQLTRNTKPGMAKYLFMVFVFLGIIWYAIYTTFIIERLENYSHASTEAHAQLVSEAFFDKMGKFAKQIVIREIIEDFDMPIIFTDMDGEPEFWFNIYEGVGLFKEPVDFDDRSYHAKRLLRRKVKEFEKRYEPKLVYFNDSRTEMGWLYYNDSSFLNGLALMPFFEILFVLVVIIGVYLVLKAVQVNERSSLWVGLAKETAHQLGTPITSLMGWIEYLDMESSAALEDEFGLGGDAELASRIQAISRDMDKDVGRLRKVANRFGLIGSLPDLERGDLKNLLEEHLAYFSKRLPTLGRRICLDMDCETVPPILMNHDLLSWVFENLFKNSLDAMEVADGHISIKVRYIEVDKKIVIKHRDSGKGVSRDNKNAVFNPGFTTKKRGWGLGLTLARRIVEEYHNGKIYISWTQKGEGTEFTIELPVPKLAKVEGEDHGNAA